MASPDQTDRQVVADRRRMRKGNRNLALTTKTYSQAVAHYLAPFTFERAGRSARSLPGTMPCLAHALAPAWRVASIIGTAALILQPTFGRSGSEEDKLK
jgi:hypothetical protein